MGFGKWARLGGAGGVSPTGVCSMMGRFKHVRNLCIDGGATMARPARVPRPSFRPAQAVVALILDVGALGGHVSRRSGCSQARLGVPPLSFGPGSPCKRIARTPVLTPCPSEGRWTQRTLICALHISLLFWSDEGKPCCWSGERARPSKPLHAPARLKSA